MIVPVFWFICFCVQSFKKETKETFYKKKPRKTVKLPVKTRFRKLTIKLLKSGFYRQGKKYWKQSWKNPFAQRDLEKSFVPPLFIFSISLCCKIIICVIQYIFGLFIQVYLLFFSFQNKKYCFCIDNSILFCCLTLSLSVCLPLCSELWFKNSKRNNVFICCFEWW